MDPARERMSLSEHARNLLRVILQHHSNLSIGSVNFTAGQFNDVLIVDDEVVFRFPRTDDAASSMTREIAVLNGLRDQLPIPIPNPTLSGWSDDGQRVLFLGYRLVPGRPLDRATLDDLWATDRARFEHLGAQIGEFLRALHAIDVTEFAVELLPADGAAHWMTMLDAFRKELFPFMRADARLAVERGFEAHLSGSFDWRPVLRHGDFGGANLLFSDDTRSLSGVIDFGSVALGDPAVDLAAVTAFDARLAQVIQAHYPELFAPDSQRRASFYRSTFALQQALWATRAGDDDEFNDGIAAYI